MYFNKYLKCRPDFCQLTFDSIKTMQSERIKYRRKINIYFFIFLATKDVDTYKSLITLITLIIDAYV